MYRVIIFDFDDTLVQTFRIRVEALKECGRKYYNLEITTEQITSIWGKSSFDIFIQEIYGYPEPLSIIKEKYFQVIKNFPNKLHDGVKETIEQLSPKYKLAIVTSGTKDIITYDMEQLGLDVDMFFKIQFANETKFHKPDPRVFEPTLIALEELGIKPDDVLFVGDSLVDHESATKAGFNFLAVTTGIYSAKDFSEKNAKSISRFSQLTDYLE